MDARMRSEMGGAGGAAGAAASAGFSQTMGAGVVLLDTRWPPEARHMLEAAGFRVEPTAEEPITGPNGVLVDAQGVRHSGIDPNKPGEAATA